MENNQMTSDTKIVEILGSALVGLWIGIAIMSFLSFFHIIDLSSKQYAYIDVEKVITSVNSSLSKQTETNNISESEVSEKLIIAKKQFDRLLSDYVKKNNAVVFTSAKAIAGAQNETEYFIKQMLVEIK